MSTLDDEGEQGAEQAVPPEVERAIAENPEAVAGLLERSGQLGELLDMLALLEDGLDDGMIESLAATGTSLGELADTAADDQVRAGLVDLLEGVGRADTEAAEPVGALGLVGALRDPEVKDGLGYLLALARGVGAERADSADVTGELERGDGRP